MEFFISLLEQRELEKNEFLLREDQSCRFISYVNKGAFRAFHINPEGKETTIMFAIADWWVTDMYCFIHQQPAMLSIQALDNGSVLQLSKQKMDSLLERFPRFEKYFRILMQNAYTREQLRVLENLSLPAAVRYEKFLEKYPKIVEKVTQKQMASYLGITPEFLSTIRKRKSGKSIS